MSLVVLCAFLSVCILGSVTPALGAPSLPAPSLPAPSLPSIAKLVLLNDAVSKGAVCLDGSPPGYYLRPGTGSGQNKLIIHMEGGGWCYNEDECVDRSKTNLGSSKRWRPTATFDGFLSGDPQANPLFYNWNMVFLMYCDGASFTGDVADTIIWKGTDLYFRGLRILKYALESIKSSGNFSEVILTGCSAGGVATYIHADYVSTIFAGVKFSALADAGFILDAPTVKGDFFIQGVVQYVHKMQNSTGSLNPGCVEAYSTQGEVWKCLFTQYSERFIKSRLFGLNSQFDTWQLANVLQLGCLPPQCSDSQMKLLENYGQEFRDAAADFATHSDRGYFVDSCLKHCQSLDEQSWTGVLVNGQRANETFADWYYGTASGQEMDCLIYPCNNSC